MRPGQVQPNELEEAILDRIAKDEHWLRLPAEGLRVLSRKYTGVGCYTTFQCDLPKQSNDPIPGLKPLIRLPNVPNGLGAVLFCRSNQPDFLELFTYGDDLWDGNYDGFYFDESVRLPD